MMKLRIAPLLAAASLSLGTQAAEPVATVTALFETAPTQACTGRRVELPLAAEALRATDEVIAGARHWVYPMAFNQITEGWNWHPERAQRGEDFYLFSYLPLGSHDEWRDSWRGEDRIGVPQEFKRHWRTDFFAGFDNLAEFVAPGMDDAAGFDFWLPLGVEPGRARLVAALELHDPCVAESTTFWKATHAQPEDFTLKKRYLLGHLLRLELHAGATTFSARTRDTAPR